MKDLKGREDIELLVNTFYRKIEKDEVIGFFFNEVAGVNWDIHIPKMVDFWDSIIFNSVEKNVARPMQAHMRTHDKHAFEHRHFDHWINLWNNTVDELFEGRNADTIKEKAFAIGETQRYKLLGSRSKDI
jgi:hemoglobin